jgi:MtN3 and saliva related transmembrane protein
MDILPTRVIHAFGFAAAILTTISFAPQLVRTHRTGGRDLSWAMLLLFGSGVGLWLLYGLFLPSWPVILANAATGAQVVMIALLKKRGGASATNHDR